MTRAESAELRALRRRFDGPRDNLTDAEQVRLAELEFKADDELGEVLRRNPLIRWDHEQTIGSGWWVCACGAGGGGLPRGRDVAIGASAGDAAARHSRQIRRAKSGGVL